MSTTMNKSTVIGRRQVLKGAGLGALAVVGTGLTTSEAAATPEKAAKAISKFTGGKKSHRGQGYGQAS